MDFKKHALILAVIDRLHKHGSWTGKTHLQKALFLLSALGAIQVPFQFVLYKHGPYSFDVEEELEQMKGYAAVVSEAVPEYGVVLRAGTSARFVKDKAPLSEAELKTIEQVCTFVGSKKATELERIATAAWIRTREQVTEEISVATRLNQLKPHVSVMEAAEADKKVIPLLNSTH